MMLNFGCNGKAWMNECSSYSCLPTSSQNVATLWGKQSSTHNVYLCTWPSPSERKKSTRERERESPVLMLIVIKSGSLVENGKCTNRWAQSMCRKIECNVAKHLTERIRSHRQNPFSSPKIIYSLLLSTKMWIKCSKYLKCKFIKFDFSCLVRSENPLNYLSSVAQEEEDGKKSYRTFCDENNFSRFQ